MFNSRLALTSAGSWIVGDSVIPARAFARSSFDPRGRPNKLASYTEQLSGWLLREKGRTHKQRWTLRQSHADLVSLGYDGLTVGWRPLSETGATIIVARSR